MEQRRRASVCPHNLGLGHLLPIVEAARFLLHHNHGLSAAIFLLNIDTSDIIRNYIHSKSCELPRELSGRLTFVSLPTLPNIHSSRTFFLDLIDLHKPLVKRAVLDRVDSKPVGFVLDMFCTSMMEVAAELHVHSYVIYTSGASLLNVMFRVQAMVDDDGVTHVFNDLDDEVEIPGFRNKVPKKVFLNGLQGCMPEVFFNIAKKLREADGILINTYQELEPYGTQTLLDMAGNGKIPAMYPVGPILELDNKSRSSGGGPQHGEYNNHAVIMEWLDQQPSSSVVSKQGKRSPNTFRSADTFQQQETKGLRK